MSNDIREKTTVYFIAKSTSELVAHLLIGRTSIFACRIARCYYNWKYNKHEG